MSSMIKKVLANVTQLFTDAEKAKARDNIGVPRMAVQGPPPHGTSIPIGNFVSCKDYDGWYYLLEDWGSSDDFETVKKIKIAPVPDENGIWSLELDQMDIGTTIPGLYYLIQNLLKIAPIAIKLKQGSGAYALMHVMDIDVHHTSSTLSEFAFSYWKEIGNPASELRMTVLTVNVNDYVDARQFSVACTEV